MKYCLKYTNVCRHLKDADEISIKYIEDRGLVDFMEKYADKRIILRIISKEFSDSEIAKLVAIKRQFPHYQFTIALDEYDCNFVNKLKEKELPFFFNYPTQGWEAFNYLATVLKVTDINVSGPLGFELPKIKCFLEKYDLKVNIRVTPNFAERDRYGNAIPHPLQHFFIRPEDLETYEPYVDVVEFEGIEHQDTFYEIYAQQKIFVGKLNQVIYNFNEPIDNVGLTKQFGERRVGCERECLGPGRCRRCFIMANLSDKLSPHIREEVSENLKKQLQDKSSEK